MRTGQRAQGTINAKIARLPREEWDFRASPNQGKDTKKGDWTAGIRFDFLPETETYYCWQYEFTRTETHAAEFFLQWRAGADKPQDFDSLLDHYWRTDPDGKSGYSLVANWFYKIWPEWPEKPYLSVPRKERQRRFKRTWEKNPKRQLKQIPLREIYRFIAALKSGERAELPSLGYSPTVEIRDDTWVISRRASPENLAAREIAAFLVDFAVSDEVLTARFQNWLVQQRKERGYKRPVSQATRVDRSDLVALGAMRLLESGLSIREAMDHTAKLSGKALYDDAGDWSRARARAKEALYRAL